jgi:hypothetical protein
LTRGCHHAFSPSQVLRLSSAVSSFDQRALFSSRPGSGAAPRASAVKTGRDTDTAGEPGGLVGQNVAKQIGGGDEAVAVGIARKRRAEGVDPHQLQPNVRVRRVQPLECADEDAFGLRQGRALMDHREVIDLCGGGEIV